MSQADSFLLVCRAAGLPHIEAEYPFAKSIGRRWRFDYAMPQHKVALEVQGAIFTQGRHTRGAALLKEHEKLNTAAAMGWRIVFVTPQQLLAQGPDWLARAIRSV